MFCLPKTAWPPTLLFITMFFAEIGIFVMRFSLTTGSQYLPIM